MSGKEGNEEEAEQDKDKEDEAEESEEEEERGDEEEVIKCQPCEDPPVIIAKSPYSPTEEEKEKHYTTHLPYRNWCPVCVQAKGKEDGHKRSKKKEDGVTTITLDYKAFSHDVDESAVTAIVMRDKETSMTYSFICTAKGSQDKWAVKMLKEAIDHMGYTKIILKTDGEPSLVQVAEEIKKIRSHDTIMQHPPAYDPASNGVAEHAVQDVMGQLRAIKIGLEQRIKGSIATHGNLLQWMIQHSSWTLNIGLVGHDGKVPRQRLLGKTSQKPILEFGEQVLAKPLRAKKTTKKLSLRTKWVNATWLGMSEKTGEHIVAVENGGAAIRVRTVKRKPKEDRWSEEALNKIQATPRRPNPKDERQEEPLPERLTTGANPAGGDGSRLPEVEIEEQEVESRNFKITKQLIERFGSTPNCKGCEGQSIGSRRAHSTACRAKFEEKMRQDDLLADRIAKRNQRLGRQEEDEEDAQEKHEDEGKEE